VFFCGSVNAAVVVRKSEGRGFFTRMLRICVYV
jgi:hypothetical protein